MKDLIDRESAIWHVKANANSLICQIKALEELPSVKPESTEEIVREWCDKRRYMIITSDFYFRLREAWSKIDQQKIVRCKDCLMHGVCAYERGLGKDGFCSQGKAKEQ